MWDNYEWSKQHIKKHNVIPEEAWEVVFHEPIPKYLRAPDQLNYPPYIRYWTIGKTNHGKELLVVWERHREVINLITAFVPDMKRKQIYEKKIKKRRC